MATSSGRRTGNRLTLDMKRERKGSRPVDSRKESKMKTKPPNMTEPQWRFIQAVCDGKVRTCSSEFKPAIACHGARLIHVFDRKFGGWDIRPTDEGIALVKKYREPQA